MGGPHKPPEETRLPVAAPPKPDERRQNFRCWLFGHQRYPGAGRYDTHWHQYERCSRCDQLITWGYGPWLGALDRLRRSR